MNRLELLALAGARFNDVLQSVGDTDWARPTPCEEWNVGQLVDHVIGGNRFTAEILGGATAEDAMAAAKAGFRDMTDRKTALAATLDAQTASFAAPGALDRICHHVAGDLPGAIVLGFRLTDLTIHGWDLARGIGADDTIPAALVETVWADVARAAPMMGTSGLFGQGPSGTIPEDADLQTRLLDATGRRP